MSYSSSFVPRFCRSGRTALLALLLWCLNPTREARAAETSLHYKFQSWQEDDQRVRVDAHYAELEHTWDSGQKLRLVGLIDSIAGATPTGQPPPDGSTEVPLSQLEDQREAGQIEYTHPWDRAELMLGYGYSTESDYDSHVWSLNSLIFFDQKNTTLRLGYAQADDKIQPSFFPTARDKTVQDAIIGVTHVVSPQTTVTANFTYGYTEGYISDPYKIIQKATEVVPGLVLDLTFPENRPDSRERLIGFVSVTHALEEQRAALETSYRAFSDDWGMFSHTLEMAWFQRVGESLIVRPAVRYYRQSAADFYILDLDGSPIVPSPNPTGAAPHYSADYRLSAMETWMLGLKVVWEINDRVTVDATYERYLMNGKDGITPDSAYADADVFTVGVRWWL